jgi:2-phospho-L-lactate guanylyltransferase
MADVTWAVIVARVHNGAKSRLASVLDPDERRRLALTMFADVLHTCVSSAPPLAGTLAVVDDAEARWIAKRGGAAVVEDPGAGDMNAAVSAGIRAARNLGATTVVVLPGDVPLISSQDLDALIDTAGQARRAVVVGQSLDGQGTNALLLRPPHVIAPAFGPPSVGRHVLAGMAGGAETRVVTDLGLALDIDTPSDLAVLKELRGDYGNRLLSPLSRGIA